MLAYNIKKIRFLYYKLYNLKKNLKYIFYSSHLICLSLILKLYFMMFLPINSLSISFQRKVSIRFSFWIIGSHGSMILNILLCSNRSIQLQLRHRPPSMLAHPWKTDGLRPSKVSKEKRNQLLTQGLKHHLQKYLTESASIGKVFFPDQKIKRRKICK